MSAWSRLGIAARSTWNRHVRSAVENSISAHRRLLLLGGLLAFPVAAGLVFDAMAGAVEQSVAGAYQRPQDRLVVVGTSDDASNWMTRSQSTAAAAIIEDQLAPNAVAWSRSLQFAPNVSDVWAQQEIVEIREVESGYLDLVGRSPDDPSRCASCLMADGRSFLLGDDVDARPIEFGEIHPVQDLSLVFAGRVGQVWRDQGLAGAVAVSPDVGARLDGDQPRPVRFAVEFDSVPTESQVAAVRSLVQPNAPETAIVEAPIGLDETASFVQELVTTSGVAVRVALVVLLVTVALGSQLLQFQRRRVEIAVLRAFGATRRDVARVAFFEGAAVGICSFVVAVAIASFTQGLLLASDPEIFRPITALALATAAGSTVLVTSITAVVAVGPACRPDPADVIRSVGE